VAHDDDQTDEFPLISGKLGMSQRDLLAEEGDGTIALMKNGTEARAGRIALDDEVAPEVPQLQHRCCSEGTLQGPKCILHLCTPAEAILAKQGGEWCDDSVVVPNEPAIVTG
jgi:hypothetical protein